MEEKADEGAATAPRVSLEPRSFVAGQECDECEKKIAMACLPCDFGGCEEHAAEHNRTCPLELPLDPVVAAVVYGDGVQGPPVTVDRPFADEDPPCGPLGSTTGGAADSEPLSEAELRDAEGRIHAARGIARKIGLPEGSELGRLVAEVRRWRRAKDSGEP